MPVVESLKPAEWQRIKSIDAAYGQAKRFYEAAGIGRGAFKSVAKHGTGLAETLAKVREQFERMDGPKQLTPVMIIELVAKEWKISADELRKGKLALARQVAAYLLEKETDLKNRDIAAELGYSDHTGVLVALNAIGDKMDTEPALRRQVRALRSKIQNP